MVDLFLYLWVGNWGDCTERGNVVGNKSRTTEGSIVIRITDDNSQPDKQCRVSKQRALFAIGNEVSGNDVQSTAPSAFMLQILFPFPSPGSSLPYIRFLPSPRSPFGSSPTIV